MSKEKWITVNGTHILLKDGESFAGCYCPSIQK